VIFNFYSATTSLCYQIGTIYGALSIKVNVFLTEDLCIALKILATYFFLIFSFQIKELEFYIKWAEISTAEPFSPVVKETKKTAKQFKKVIVRRKELDGTNTKYLLDFGKRNKEQIPPIVVRYGTKHEELSSERVKYWLGENYVPLSLVRAFEERKLSRQLKKRDGSPSSKQAESKPKKHAAPLDKLIEPSPKKRRQSDVLGYLFEKTQKMEMKKCSHCDQDVLVRY
jgi:hypothetical protein